MVVIFEILWALVFSKNFVPQLGSAVSDFRLIAASPEVATDTPSRTIRVTLSSDPKMLPRDSEDVAHRELSCLACRFHIEDFPCELTLSQKLSSVTTGLTTGFQTTPRKGNYRRRISSGLP